MTNYLIHIAIADEHPIFREGLATTINSFTGFRASILAEDGNQLLEYLESADTIPDICLFDISLPVVNGYDMLKEIKKRWPQLKVLILSMHDNELNMIRMIKVGANGFMVKACTPDELHKALLAIADNGYYYSEAKDQQYLDEMKNSISLQLSYGEMEFMSLCCTEMTSKAIAEKMNISQRTLDNYKSSLYKKLNVSSRVGLVLFALNIGITPSSAKE